MEGEGKGENIKAKKQNFYKRWNIEYNEQEKQTNFKELVLSTIDEVLGELFLKDRRLLREYFKLAGKLLVLSETGIGNLTKALSGDTFKDSPVYSLFMSETRFNKIILYTQTLFWLDIDSEQKEVLFKKIKDVIESSSLDITIKKTKDGEYIFYPRGAKLLDEGVVNDILDWLAPYPEAYKNFVSALKKYQDRNYERNLIDDLRLSLELLLKKILKNNMNLKNQKGPLGNYLKEKGAPPKIRNMFITLLMQYDNYQNEHAKHKDKIEESRIKESEIEFIIYLTGTFMRFLLSL